MGQTFQSPTGSGTSLPGAVCDDMLRPRSLSASVNDYGPPGHELISTIEVAPSTDVSMTGLQGGIDGRTVTLMNRGPGVVLLPAEDVGSLEVNRFVSEVTIAADSAAMLRWSRLVGRWCPLAAPPGGGGGGGALTITRANPADATRVGGITAATDGSLLAYRNVSADALIVFVDEDPAATAADRLQLPRPRMFLMPGESAEFLYDGTAARWAYLHTSRDPLQADDTAQSFWTSTVLPAAATAGAYGASAQNLGPAGSIGTASSANTNEFAQGQVFSASTSGAAGNFGGVAGVPGPLRGSASAYGGFFFYARARWGIHAANDLGALMLSANSPSGAGVTANPSTYNDSASISWDAGQTTLRARSRDGAATTNVDLGVNFPSNVAAAAYEIVIACANGAARINYFVRRLDSAVADAIGSLTTNLPTATSPLVPSLFISNNATAAPAQTQWNALNLKGGW